jgi:hypothetical protein
MSILDLYGSDPNQPHREFIQVVLVFYSQGNVDKLLSLVEKARRAIRVSLGRSLRKPPSV